MQDSKIEDNRTLIQQEARSARTGQAEDELARFFYQSLDLLCIAGIDGYFKRLNPAWPVCLGWTVAELKADPFLHFVHADDRDATQRKVEELSEGIKVICFENRFRHKDGSFRWLRWNSRTEPDGQLIYATARDVTRQKQLEREILETVDQERERMSRELHDGLCQGLAGIAALSATLAKKLAQDGESTVSDAAAEITDLVNDSIRQAHDMSRGLGPFDLTHVGLPATLKDLSVSVEHLHDVACTIEVHDAFPTLANRTETHLFRITQEAVRNALTHGKSDRIQIDLSYNDSEGRLSIRDNGDGLPDVESISGSGLHTMNYRARLIGGSLEVRPRTRHGTCVTCRFPLNVN